MAYKAAMVVLPRRTIAALLSRPASSGERSPLPGWPSVGTLAMGASGIPSSAEQDINETSSSRNAAKWSCHEQQTTTPTSYCPQTRDLASTEIDPTKNCRKHTSTCSCCCCKCVQSLMVCSLIFASYLSDTFVARGEEDDKHEGE